DDLEIDAVIAAAAERFTAELQQHAVVLRGSVTYRYVFDQDSLMLNRAKRRTVMFSWSFEMFSAMIWPTVRLGSRKYSCSVTQFCLRKSSFSRSSIIGLLSSSLPCSL